MKRSWILWSLSCLLLITFTVDVSARDNTLTYRNAKSIGMGDTRIAAGFNYNGFVDNPALLSRVKYVRFSLFNIPIIINRHFFDVGNFINDSTEKFKKFDDLSNQEKVQFLDDVQKYGGKWSRLNFSPMIDFGINIFGHGIGLAIFNTSDATIKLDRGIYEPRVWGEGISDYAVVLGYARPLTILYPGLKVGINLKYLERHRANLFQIKASDLGNIQETIEPILDEYKNEKHKNFTVDIGALWDIPIINSDIGATIQSIGDGQGASVDIGVAKRMSSDNLILLADYIDFFDNNKENTFKKLHFGAEYSYLFLALRLGINSGYPTLGLGLNFKVVDLDMAYFYDELGNAPGVNEDERYIVQLKMGW